MAAATLTADGSIQIPKSLRDELQLKAGDRVKIERDPRGLLLIQPDSEPRLGRLAGLLRHRAPRRALTVEEMHQAVLEEAESQLRQRDGE